MININQLNQQVNMSNGSEKPNVSFNAETDSGQINQGLDVHVGDKVEGDKHVDNSQNQTVHGDVHGDLNQVRESSWDQAAESLNGFFSELQGMAQPIAVDTGPPVNSDDPANTPETTNPDLSPEYVDSLNQLHFNETGQVPSNVFAEGTHPEAIASDFSLALAAGPDELAATTEDQQTTLIDRALASARAMLPYAKTGLRSAAMLAKPGLKIAGAMATPWWVGAGNIILDTIISWTDDDGSQAAPPVSDRPPLG